MGMDGYKSIKERERSSGEDGRAKDDWGRIVRLGDSLFGL